MFTANSQEMFFCFFHFLFLPRIFETIFSASRKFKRIHQNLHIMVHNRINLRHLYKLTLSKQIIMLCLAQKPGILLCSVTKGVKQRVSTMNSIKAVFGQCIYTDSYPQIHNEPAPPCGSQMLSFFPSAPLFFS